MAHPTYATLQIIAEYEAARRYALEQGKDPDSMLRCFVEGHDLWPTDHIEMIMEHEKAVEEQLSMLRIRQ